MKCLLFPIFIVILLFKIEKTKAQEIHPFNLILDTINLMFDDVPLLNQFNPLSNGAFEKTTYPHKKNIYPLQTTLNLSGPVFLLVINTPVLALPKRTMRGCISDGGFKLWLYDGSDVNNFIRSVNDSAQKFHVQRRAKKLNVAEYVTNLEFFKGFINRQMAYINSAEAEDCYQLNNETKEACIEYCQMMLADYIVFPFYTNDAADKLLQIETEIRRSVRIKKPYYWLNTMAGRSFLTTYFFDILLPGYSNDLEKILSMDPLCRHSPVKRYLGYQYFASLLKNDSAFTDYMWAVKSIDEYKKKYDCSRDDIKMFDKLREQFLRKGNDVSGLFAKQDLVNYAGKQVKEELLKEKGKVLVYYWASWCIPCLETISKIKNTTATYEGKQYKTIFISIDKKQEQWVKTKKDALTAVNSFRLTNFVKKSFYNVFQVNAVPRIFYIDDGRLIETNYPKEKFRAIFTQ